MQFELAEQREDGIRLIHVSGRIDRYDLDADTNNPIADVLGEGWAARRIGLCFTNVEYLNSAAVGWIVELARTIEENGGALVLYSVTHPSVSSLFKVISLGKAIPILSDETAAVDTLLGRSK